MTSPVESSATSAAQISAGDVAAWPLTFKRHLFGAVCFDTRGCEVLYDGRDHGTAAQTPSAASLAPERYEAAMIARYGDLPNFPPPAELHWRSKDGSEHRATVDLAEIFKDSLIRHRVPRDAVAEGVSPGYTHVLVEVNDRTVSVYTRTMIPTRDEQIPGNRHSRFRDDLIQVYSRRY